MGASKTARFSNGHVDTYKGKRDVKAAWMITEKATGEVVKSGHSLDRLKAEKTARGNIPTAALLPAGWRDHKNTIAGHKHARSMGFRTPSAYENDVKRRNAEKALEYQIEVIDL